MMFIRRTFDDDDDDDEEDDYYDVTLGLCTSGWDLEVCPV